jgi:hypothetical protein
MIKRLHLAFMSVLWCTTLFAQSTCATAEVIPAGTYSFVQFQGNDIPLPVCSTGGTGATAGQWYKYTAPANLEVTVTSDFPGINGNTDNRVQVYTGSCGSLTCIAGDDDAGSGLLCVVSFNVVENTDYYIAFDNRWSSNGFTFELIENSPPPTPEIVFVSESFPTIVGEYKIAIADMNGDYLDDIVSISSTKIDLLLQQPDGDFEPQSITTTPAQYLPTWSMAIGDYNKDGFNDLMYGSGSGVSFFRSNSTGTAYTHWAAPNYVFSQRTNFIDIDNDGHLDAFACHDVAPNVYYMNDGAGNLSFNQGGFGNHLTGGHYATIWFDYDNDGDVDLFISKCSGGGQGAAARFNEMHRNNGDGTFTNVSVAANMNHGNQTWSSAVNDFDNDGYMDVIVGVSSFADGGHLFMHNNGDGTFTDIAEGSGWDTYNGVSIEYVSYDFNNDGWADVFTNGRIFLNNGDNTFTIQTVAPNVGAVGDLNNDGFLDIQNGTTIYFNQPNGNNWVKLNLKGVESNSNGIGARVELHGSWGKQIRDVQSGIGFRHMGTLNVHFGIGTADAIDSVVVKWPSGQVDVICNPEINTALFVLEGAGLTPLAQFDVSETMVPQGTVVSFQDLTEICPYAWNWSVAPENGWEFTNGTDSYSQNPEILFTQPGFYTVSLVATNGNGESVNDAEVLVVVTSTAGLTDNASNKVMVYPNPAQHQLTIYSDKADELNRVELVSAVGTIISTYPAGTTQLDLSGLSNGTYFVRIETASGEQHTVRFIKQ